MKVSRYISERKSDLYAIMPSIMQSINLKGDFERSLETVSQKGKPTLFRVGDL